MKLHMNVDIGPQNTSVWFLCLAQKSWAICCMHKYRHNDEMKRSSARTRI